MSLRLQVDPGGEKYLSWAKSKLDQMKAFMRQSGMKAQSKHYFISTSESIWVKSLCVGYDVWLDWIRITAGAASGFIVYPRVSQLVSPFTSFEFDGSTPVRLRFDQTDMSDLTEYSAVASRFHAAGGLIWTAVRKPDGAWGHNYKGQFSAAALSSGYIPFRSDYTAPDGSAATKLLVVNGSIVSEIVAGALVPLSTSGTAAHPAHDIAPNGRAAVGLVNDTLTQLAVDYGASPQVVLSDTTLSGYGTRTTYDDYDYAARAVFHDVTIESSATYPVAYGYSTSSTSQQIGVVHTVAKTGSQHGSLSIDCVPETTGGTYSSSGTISVSGSETLKIVMPNGVEKTLSLGSYSAAGAATFSQALDYFCTLTGGQSYGGSGATFARSVGAVEILYADASLPVVVYRHTLKTYNATPSISGGAYALTPVDMGRVTTVTALIGATELVLDTVTEAGVASDGGEFTGIDFPGVPSTGSNLAGIWNGYSPSSGSTVTPTSLDTNSYAKAAKEQSSTLAFAARDAATYVGQYVDAAGRSVQFGSGPVRATLIGWLTSALTAKESAVPPTITAEEQALLGALRAGSLDDYALNLGASGISAIS